jgi:Domain of unknown function (DUF1508)
LLIVRQLHLIIASGRDYKSKAAAEKGIESVKANAVGAAGSITPPDFTITLPAAT